VPKKSKPAQRQPLYRKPPPKPKGVASALRADSIEPPVFTRLRRGKQARHYNFAPHAHPISSAPFELREDGSIESSAGVSPAQPNKPRSAGVSPASLDVSSQSRRDACATLPRLVFSSDTPYVRLYCGNSLELLDAIAAKYPEGRFDAIFADPPYFLSNGGITCHAGKMVKVDKGDWDVSRGPELDHEFNRAWLERCQRVLKPNGTIWVTGTHHVIFSIGYALQQLGFKILNDIAWEKPNPPPNLSCRYFTHSTETVLWAAKNEKSKHVFNYQEMRKVTGKQMKTVWRDVAKQGMGARISELGEDSPDARTQTPDPAPDASENNPALGSIWTIGAPATDEKKLGKHPTQKPVALVERCLLASTNEGDLVLDPFLGNGTTAVASVRLKRGCVGVELDLHHVEIAARRADREIIEIWLRHFRVRIDVSVVGRAELPLRLDPHFPRPQTPDASPQIDLDLFSDSINGSRAMDDKPQVPTERIFHECKFVFLSCAQVERGAVVHTTVDISLQEAWAKTPNGKKRETTHVVRCETEIFRVKNS
jgi:site-specific DNA-methyltransferase (adenine-specific)